MKGTRAGPFSHERALLSALAADQGDLVCCLLRSADLAKVTVSEARHSLAAALTDVAALLRLRCTGHCRGQALQQALCSLSAAAAAQRLSAEKPTDLGALVERFRSEVAPLLLAGKPVSFSCRVEPVPLPPQAAACIAMLLNELLLNAAQHAFPDGHRGAIALSAAVKGRALVIEVSDDGAGFNHHRPRASHHGLGLRIVKQIVHHQLGGTFSIHSDGPRKGTRACVRMPLPSAGSQQQWIHCASSSPTTTQ